MLIVYILLWIGVWYWDNFVVFHVSSVENVLLWHTRMQSWPGAVQETRWWWWWRWWRAASEEGLLLPLALVTSATCRKVKRSAFEPVCSTAADDVDRAWDRVKARREGQEKEGAQCREPSGLQWEGFLSRLTERGIIKCIPLMWPWGSAPHSSCRTCRNVVLITNN